MDSENPKDVLIIGQGIAGTMLGCQAEKFGLSFEVYDKGALSSASFISSGIINPVTGPKFVKSWMIDELLPVATSFYQELEAKSGQKFLHDLPIWCHLQNINKENLWQSRMLDPGYDRHISDPADIEALRVVKDIFSESNHWGIVHSAKYVEVSKLLKYYRDVWLHSERLKEHHVELTKLHKSKGLWHYGVHAYKKVILALGHKGSQDEWFPTQHYNLVKGDLVICKIKGLPKDKVLKNGKFLLPLGDDLFWVGSNYDREFTNVLPDVKQVAIIERFLKEEIGLPYEILEHKSGIRPAIDFRLPLVGEHPLHKGLFLFNGMGTKGVSLAPYFSHELIESIAQLGTTFKSKGFIKCFG